MGGHINRVGAMARLVASERVAGAVRRASNGRVSLTFDDGPWPGATDGVLDVLAGEGVHATFFCVGRNAETHPGLLREIDAAGHAVGSHSYTHPHPRDLPLGPLKNEYVRGAAVVSDVVGRSVRLFRPPHGHISLAAAAMLRRLPLDTWLWSVDPEDWRPRRTTKEIVDGAACADRGDVVLLHDWVEQPWNPCAQDRSAMIKALRVIVNEVRERGLEFATLGS